MSNPQALALANSYKDTVASIATLASSGILPLLDSLEGASFLQLTRELRPAMLELGEQFAWVSAEASVAYYDELRTVFPPKDAEEYKARFLFNPLQHTERLRNEIAYTFNDVPSAKSYDAVKSSVVATVQDGVKKASFSNMVENIKKDKALVVITYMPSTKACRFCRSIISQGRTNYRWTEGDSAYGGSGFMAAVYRNGNQFHKRCACTPVPRFVSSQGEGDYDTKGQEGFNKDFKTAAKQADKLGVSMDTPKQAMQVMRSYEDSYRIPKGKVERVKAEAWGRIVGPKWNATEKELLEMKALLASNDWKPFVLPKEQK